MSDKLRIGLIGAGKFGGYHANKLDAHPSVNFSGIFDVSLSASTALSEKHGVEYFKQFDDLVDVSDALIVASPASYHGVYALRALEAGQNLLIEKPLATTLKDAKKIVEITEKKNLVVQVGHQERFVGRAIGLDKVPEKPILIKAERLNPYSPRGTDTSVTMDLMTHDIDLVLWLMGEPPESVRGAGRKIKSDTHDHVVAELSFSRGKAFLEASRDAPVGHREFEITYPSGTVTIDLNAKSLVNQTPFKLNRCFGESPQAKDSLAAGLDEFVSAIKEQRAPFISARDGLMAVDIATKVDTFSPVAAHYALAE